MPKFCTFILMIYQKQIEKQQRNEITEFEVYKRLSEIAKEKENKTTLFEIANTELKHYNFWKNITKKEFKPNKKTVRKHILLAKLFGLSFSLRLLEKGESRASKFYSSISKEYPEALAIQKDEEEHENQLIEILNDYRLIYAGAIVLGLNDALVEFTGTLAGLTFAFANNMIIATTGLIMGVAASLSMAASGYLSSREDDHNETNPITSAIYTGVAYIVTVFLLVGPYLLLKDPFIAFVFMLMITIMIIASYTFYISIAKAISFKKRFLEMAVISLGVAVVSFGIGYFIRIYFNVDV